MTPKMRRREEKNPLQTLLLKACPPDLVDGSVSVPRLAEHLDMTTQGIYKWINGQRITVKGAKLVVEKSGDRVTMQDFVDFL